MGIKRVIIWKHLFKINQSGSHTFIHQAYYNAFKYLNYETYWCDNLEELNIDNYEGTLFFLEGNHDGLPLRDDCYYVLHHVDNKPFIEKGCKFVNLCNFLLKSALVNESYNYPLDNSGQHGKYPLYSTEKIKPHLHYDIKNKAIYQPWGTNLLPHEINDEPINYKKSSELNFIGSVWSENINQILPMIQNVIDNGINFNIYGWLQFNDLKHNKIIHKSLCGLPESDAIDIVKSSIFYPDVRGEHHINLGYIPCRLFKNISYGCMPITNSKLAFEFFEEDILYSPNTKDFLNISVKYYNNRDIEREKRMIKFVKENHTYVNRVNDLVDFIKIIYG